MNQRWKFQFIMGIVFATTTLIVLSIFNLIGGTFEEKWASGEMKMQIPLLYILGIFGLGYYLWKQKNKKEKHTQP